MIIGVYGFLSSVNRSSVNVFITTMNSRAVEASTCTMKYFNEVSVLYMFLTFDITEINNIRVISRHIHTPSHELEDTSPTTVNSKRTLVELLGNRQESLILCLGV